MMEIELRKRTSAEYKRQLSREPITDFWASDSEANPRLALEISQKVSGVLPYSQVFDEPKRTQMSVVVMDMSHLPQIILKLDGLANKHGMELGMMRHVSEEKVDDIRHCRLEHQSDCRKQPPKKR